MSKDYIYYNGQLVCKKNNATDPDLRAYFNETRDQFLDNGNNYTFSIIRFTLKSNNLPIHIPKIQIGQNDINLTSYGLKMSDGTHTTDPEFLEYDCRNKYFNNNVAPPTTQQADDPYYYMFDLNHFVDMFNTAVSNCLTNLKALNNTITAPSPYLELADNNTFSLYVPNTFITQNVSISLNDDLYNLLRNFRYRTINNNGFNYQFLFNATPSNSQTYNTILYNIQKQSNTSMFNFSPIQNLTFLTTLGLRYELTSNLQILNNDTLFGETSNQQNNICTDICLDITNPMDYNSFIDYTASVYRESDINTTDIRQLDVSVNWRNAINGKLYPVMLSDGDYMTVKIKFQRKKENNNK